MTYEEFMKLTEDERKAIFEKLVNDAWELERVYESLPAGAFNDL
jgi:hypothetical protein